MKRSPFLFSALVAIVAATSNPLNATGPSLADDTAADGATLGLVVVEGDPQEEAFQHGVKIAIDEWNRSHPDDLIVVAARPIVDLGRDAKAAVAELAKANPWAILPPLLGDNSAIHSAARAAKIPTVDWSSPTKETADAILRFVVGSLRVQTIGLVMGQGRIAKDLAKELQRTLPHPSRVATEFAYDLAEKGVTKRLEKSPVSAFVIDASPAEAAEAITVGLASQSAPIILTRRALGAETRALNRELFVLLGQAPNTVAGGSTFLTEWRTLHGEPGYGAAEGYDVTRLLLKTRENGTPPTGDALTRALEGTRLRGPRGEVEIVDGAMQTPLVLWKLASAHVHPYLPSPIDAELLQKGTSALRDPDPELGSPFGTFRTDRFELDPDSQWVLVSYGDAGASTIDEDLALLGLSSGGSAPLVDHLVKEELMARLLSFTSLKFHRNVDGTSKPGESLKISFSTFLPPKGKPGKAWKCVVAGDDEFAGGRAWPGEGRCEVYCTFIRRTIFQDHALVPPVGGDDLIYLDGSYRFGTDPAQDKRHELIRALINGYAGSMALTTAHEIGHVAGLGHITDDPLGIMNVEEGSGVDHRDGQFTAGSMEKLEQRLGRTPTPKGK